MNVFQKYLAQGTAIVTVIVGQVVAYVPAWAPDSSHIISAGSFALAIGLMLHDALKVSTIHQVTGEAETVAKVDETHVRKLVQGELARLMVAVQTESAPAATSASAQSPLP